MVRFGVLISGSGTNLQAVIDAIAAGTLDAQVPIVVSSRPDAYGIERARAAGIETLVLSRETYADPRAADARIVEALQRAGCDYVVMAGYMRKVTVHFANAEYDKGPIIAQRAVVVAEGDTVDALEAKIHAVEHELYPETLALIASGRVSVGEDRKVHVA